MLTMNSSWCVLVVLARSEFVLFYWPVCTKPSNLE